MRLSIEIDPKLVERLSVAQDACLFAAAATASLVLTAWFMPSVAFVLPSFWILTKATTASLALATTVGLALSHPQRKNKARLVSRLLIMFVGVVAVAVLCEYIFHVSFSLELLLPYDHHSATLGRMAPQTAIAFALLSVVTLFLTQRKNVLAAIADVALTVLAISVLTNTAGSLFGATRMYGIASNTIAPSTMIWLLLLTFVAFGRRAEYGVFAIMLGRTPGSRIARIAFPLALILPFGLETVRSIAIYDQLISPNYASAVSITVTVLLAFSFILILAWRMLTLERELLDLSLRDDVTQLYNRRGLYLMAEQALWLARRSAIPFFVLYIDLDGLKAINDTKGHDVGSDFIREAGDLLKQVVRRTDIVGRVGGDEFVVAGQSVEGRLPSIVDRIKAAAENKNTLPDRPYYFSLSVGYVSSSGGEALEDLLHQADMAMYESKTRKKRLKSSTN